MRVAIRADMRLQLSREPARFTRAPRRVLVYRQGARRAVVWRSSLALMSRHDRPYTVLLLRSDGGDCRTESHRTVPAALDTARGWVTGAIAE